MEIETSYTKNVIPDAYSDEWTWCEAVGTDVCGPVLENHCAPKSSLRATATL